MSDRDLTLARVRALVDRAFEAVPPVWPLGSFIATNPLGNLEDRPMREAIAQREELCGARGYLDGAAYLDLFERGEISPDALEAVLGRHAGEGSAIVAQRYYTSQAVVRAFMTYGGDPAPLLPAARARLALEPPSAAPARMRTIGDLCDDAFGSNVRERIDERAIAWCSAFTDEGQAAWPMPGRDRGFYNAWRSLARHDTSDTARSIGGYRARIGAVPERPEAAIAQVLDAFGIPRARWDAYLTLHVLALPGWAGLARRQSAFAAGDRPAAGAFEPAGYLAMRLWYERALAESIAARSGVEPSYERLLELAQAAGDAAGRERVHLARDVARIAAGLGLSAFDIEALSSAELTFLLDAAGISSGTRCRDLWLAAHERTVHDRLIAELGASREPDSIAPAAGLVFCIDARSEGLRRALEAAGPYSTRGFAGFFGLPIAFRPLDSAHARQACPVLLTPKHTIAQKARGESRALGGRVFLADLERILAEVKSSVASPFVLFESIGAFFALALAGRTFFARAIASLRERIVHALAPEPEASFVVGKIEDEPELGFTADEQLFFAEVSLALMDLRSGFPPLVVFVGHGSSTENNPFEASLDCGACGGHRGGPNARILAQMLNDPALRAGLTERGIVIPAATFFLGAEHDTATDRVVFPDAAAIPAAHAAAFARLETDLRAAGERLAAERAASLPLATGDPAAQVALRSVDWAQVRPEWGLARNAAFIIGPRSLTRGARLDRRAFLHEYDAAGDADGSLLEIIMTAPLVVAQWINSHYYFASVDNERYGSGNKVIHNVVGGVGVMLGNRSDLKAGLPWQSVASGDGLYHDPVRLLAVVAAPLARIDAVIARNSVLQRLFEHEWMSLAAWEPSEGRFYRYHPGREWEPHAPGEPPTRDVAVA